MRWNSKLLWLAFLFTALPHSLFSHPLLFFLLSSLFPLWINKLALLKTIKGRRECAWGSSFLFLLVAPLWWLLKEAEERGWVAAESFCSLYMPPALCPLYLNKQLCFYPERWTEDTETEEKKRFLYFSSFCHFDARIDPPDKSLISLPPSSLLPPPCHFCRRWPVL